MLKDNDNGNQLSFSVTLGKEVWWNLAYVGLLIHIKILYTSYASIVQETSKVW